MKKISYFLNHLRKIFYILISYACIPSTDEQVATDYKAYLKNNSRFCAQAAIINVFLDVISPESNWSQNLYSLMVEHPEINIVRIGFSKDWYVDPFWGVNDNGFGALAGHSEITNTKSAQKIPTDTFS